MTANRRYRIAVHDLRLNMFVVELDRPWLDTPFLLQGFLIDDQVELDTLVRYCNYVYVDLELSSPSVAWPSASPTPTSAGSSLTPRATPAPSRPA